MYGLFHNICDYYEWHDLICVSESKAALISHYKSIGTDEPLLGGIEQENAAGSETHHYVIEKVKVVPAELENKNE